MNTDWPITDASIQTLARDAGELLRARGLKIVAAESCTGGWLAKAMTDVAGSSAWFDRGFVTYSNEAKSELLDVNEGRLQKFGAVSEEVAWDMAIGARRNSRADVAIAITGIAGPDGGTAEKPVGTVWIAWFCANEDTVCMPYLFSGDREMVRRAAVIAAMEGLLRLNIIGSAE